MIRAFISYQTADKGVAGAIAKFLDGVGIQPFLAHEDIDVSHEWQDVILKELGRCDVFVVILSQAYLQSAYCLQESGIAVFRNLTIIPLAIDNTTSPGFAARIQSRRIDPTKIDYAVLFAGIARFDRKYAIDLMINRLGAAKSYAAADSAFALLHPYLEHATKEQRIDVLKAAASNNQVAYAWGCREGLRELLETDGQHIAIGDCGYLMKVLDVEHG